MYNFQDIIKKFIDKQLLWVYYKSVITQFICPLEVVIPLYGNRQNLRAFLFIKEFLQMIRIAILVDGGFYRKRANRLFGKKSPEERAAELDNYCKKHLSEKNYDTYLYRVFYYDCPPSDKNVYHPLLQINVNMKKSELYEWMNTFLSILKSKRKFALRLGRLSDNDVGYTLRPEAIKSLFSGKIDLKNITENDFKLDIKQKTMDMKLGTDIASISLKKQVDRIILIAGDSDFVPAAKLSRREGIDFILDPMGQNINPDLNEHIDGIRSKINYFIPKK